MKVPDSKRGFYIISPFLGIFFFLITVSITALYVIENNQQIETARAGEEHELAFISSAIAADALDVYFQNYLQQVLNNHVVGGDLPIKTELTEKVKGVLSTSLEATYKSLYDNAFGIDCDITEAMYSLVALRFLQYNNGEWGIAIPGTSKLFSPDRKAVIWPYISHYGLECYLEEPPIESGTEFKSRWYYLDADCICCQAPHACGLDYPPTTCCDTPRCAFCGFI